MQGNRSKVIKKAAKSVVESENVDKLIEEMAELTFSLLKLRYNPESEKWLKEVQGELSDVKASLDININIFGRKQVAKRHRTKLSKIKKRL